MGTIYVRAKSKKELNARLDAGHTVHVTEYHYDGRVDLRSLGALPHSSVVRLYHRTIGSTPVASSYGQWDAIKRRVK